MRNASKAFRWKLLDDKRNYKVKLVTTLANNTVLNITEQDIWSSSFKFSDATSGTTSFDLGSAIINKLNFALNNMYNKYSAYDFNGATVICHVGLTLDDGTTEYLKIGHFTVYEQPSYNGSLISFTCYDNMYKFDKKITEMTGNTMGVVVANICSAIGVSINTPQFNGYNLAITLPTNITTMTYRQLLSYIAQLTGNFARINSDGLLELKWYDTDFYSSETNLDGGTFKTTTTPYSDGDNANGGDFTFSETTDYDGGTFTELATFHHIYSLNSQSFSTDDVIITGVKLTDSSQKVYSIGTTEYALSIENNPLVTPTNAQTYVNFLGTKLIGMRFRKFSVSALSDPTIECGDNAKISDNKGHTYLSFVNSNTFNIGNFQPIACNCASPLQNSSEKNSATTQTIINARKVVTQEISSYDLQVQQLTDLITTGYGMFPTKIIDDNGGIIYYMHDKPIMAESTIRWFMTSGGMIEQNKVDGVWATVSGTDKQGNALYNVLTARGINVDWLVGNLITGKNIVSPFGTNGKMELMNGTLNLINTLANKIMTIGMNKSTDVFGSTPYLGLNANIESFGIGTTDNDYASFKNIYVYTPLDKIHHIYGDTVFSGNVDFGTGITGHIPMLDNYAVWWSGGAYIFSPYAQRLVLRGSSEEDYGIVIGVQDSSWGMFPVRDAYLNLGSTSRRWANIYAQNGTIVTSDENCKTNITQLDSEKMKPLLMAIQPISYKMIDGTSGRTHCGFGARQLESVMNELEIDSKDFAGFIKSPKYNHIEEETVNEKGETIKIEREELVENEYIYALRYDEFIAPILSLVQSQEKRITQLETLVQQLLASKTS